MSLVLAAVAAPVKSAATTSPQPIQTTLNQQPVAVRPETWFQLHAGWLTHGLAGLAFLMCVALVALLAIQTTKQEGLSGTIGGQVQSAYGRPGAEEQLKRITGVVATLFVVLFVILSLTGI